MCGNQFRTVKVGNGSTEAHRERLKQSVVPGVQAAAVGRSVLGVKLSVEAANPVCPVLVEAIVQGRGCD